MPKAGTPAFSDGNSPPTPDSVLTEMVDKTAAELNEKMDMKSAISAFAGFSTLADEKEYLNALLFGQEATGKTTALAHAVNLADEGIVVIINVESGLKPTALKRFGLETDRIVMWPNRAKGEKITYDGMEELYWKLSAMLEKEPGSVLAVGIDSYSEVTTVLLENITRAAFAAAAENSRLAQRDDVHTTMVQDYGKVTNQVRSLIRKFRDLPCHFFATALEAEFKDDGVEAIGPELSPKIRTAVLGYVDVAIRYQAESLTVDAKTRTLVEGQCRKSHRVRAKDRFGVLPHMMAQPTVDRVWAYITGELTEATDPLIKEYQDARDAAEAEKARAREARLNRNKK